MTMTSKSSMVRLGPKARLQLLRLGHEWRQGEHVLVTGGTGSGKTLLARYLDQMRLDRRGSVVVFVCKLQPDDTITNFYSAAEGWVRWKRWKRKPNAAEDRILLWPDVEGKSVDEANAIMREVFLDALQEISKIGKWTVHLDEGLMLASPAYLNLGDIIGLMYALMRSSKGTLITLAQRPSNLPLSIYANISYAFVGAAREASDLKRLAELDSTLDSRSLARMIQQNQRYDFVMIPCGTGAPPERINLSK